MMSIHQLAQHFEIKFWDIVIPVMEEKGPLMKIISFLKQLLKTKSGFLTLLILILAIIGFFSGLILGKVIWMVQLL